jgi:hypothetical protein
MHGARTADTGATPFQHIKEGFRWVKRTRPIRALLLLLGLVSMVEMPYAGSNDQRKIKAYHG